MALRHVPLKDRDLAYLPDDTPEFQEYMRDLLWAQDFALANREEMMDRAMTELSFTMFQKAGHEQAMTRQRINCHHNFTQLETHFGKRMWITRKGAIEMKAGQMGDPGSGRGLHRVGVGNAMSYNSALTAQGKMSRSEARKRFTMQDLETAMEGFWRTPPQLIDKFWGL